MFFSSFKTESSRKEEREREQVGEKMGERGRQRLRFIFKMFATGSA